MNGSPATRPAPELPPGPRSALVVATTTYADPVLRRLRSPTTDAAELAGALADPAIGGFEVTPVLDPTWQQLRDELHDFLAGRGPEDLVVVYLSCHGLTDPRRRLYFAGSNTLKARLAATGVESSWVLDRLDECRARSQVLILDCCFSGAFARGFKGAEELDLHDRLAPTGRGRAVLTASNAREYSFEGGLDGVIGPGETAPGSVFTSALLEGLSTGAADADANGWVTVDEAYNYAYRQVRATGAAQTPQRWLTGGEGQIVLARNPAGVPIHRAPVPHSLRAALDSPHPLVRRGAVGELGEWLASGEPGRQVTAHDELEKIAETDIALVAAAARRLLPLETSTRVEPRHNAVSATSGWPAPSDTPAVEESTAHQPEQAPLAWTGATPTVLRGHTGGTGSSGGVLSVAFSSQGGLLATAGSDKTVRLWNPNTGEHLRTLNGHTKGVTAVAFSLDGRLLATGSVDKTVQLWSPKTGERLAPLIGHMDSVRAVAFSPDGQWLAAGSDAATVCLWNPKTAEYVRNLTGHRGAVYAVAFSPDGHLLASGSEDMTVRLWDVHTGVHLRTLIRHLHEVRAVAFSPDGNLLASAGDRHVRVQLSNPQTGESLGSFTAHTREVGPVAFTSWVRAVAFSPDGRLLASGGGDKNVRLWNPETYDQVRVLAGHRKRVNAVAFSLDGRMLASGSSDNHALVWHVS